MAQIKVWDPRDPFRIFDEMRSSFPMVPADWDAGIQQLPVNMIEEEENYIVEASIAVPALKPEDIDIAVEDRYLTISGETKEDSEDRKKKYHLREMYSATFSRTVMLPGNVDVEKVDAKFDKGVLKITLPKLTKSTSKKIAVK